MNLRHKGRDLGLGSTRDVSLEDAREFAANQTTVCRRAATARTEQHAETHMRRLLRKVRAKPAKRAAAAARQASAKVSSK